MDNITWDIWKDTAMPNLDKEYEVNDKNECELVGTAPVQWEYSKEYLADYAYEHQVCKGQAADLFTFQEWVALEQFFGQRITYKQYNDIAAYYNEDPEVDGNILELGGKDPFIPAFRKGDDAIFTSSDSDSDLKSVKVRILRLLTPDEADLFEVGPMYKVQTDAGDTVFSYYDELAELPAKKKAS